MDKIQGIYKITNLINGKCYIGKSEDIDYRKKKHFKELAEGKHHLSYLQEDDFPNMTCKISYLKRKSKPKEIISLEVSYYKDFTILYSLNKDIKLSWSWWRSKKSS